MQKLSVNIDHVATLRQSRHTPYPDPVYAAVIAQLGGADGITVHPREDRRHIQDRDVELLKETLQVPLTLEMALTDAMVALALDIKPYMCTIVPESREEQTTESGLAVAGNESILQPKVLKLLDAGILVSIFIDTNQNQIKAAKNIGADYIEIHTGPYALTTTPEEQDDQLTTVVTAAKFAKELDLGVNAGHGLHYQNTAKIAALKEIDWLHTGHSIISQALFIGLQQAVRDMKDIMINATICR
jgi:pyridoxine 5-phosphate synthase